MEDVLNRLLKAESRAEAMVNEAAAAREAMVSQAEEQARAAEEAFAARIPAIRDEFLKKAENDAIHTLEALKQRYESQRAHMQATMEQHEAEAVEAAVALLLDPVKG